MQIRERATQYEENPQVDHNLEVRKKYNTFCITFKLIFLLHMVTLHVESISKL